MYVLTSGNIISPFLTTISLSLTLSPLYQLLLVAAREAGIGVLYGFLFSTPFYAIQFAGEIFGLQMGFGLVNVIDPTKGTHVSLLGQMLFVGGALVFFEFDGHLAMINFLHHALVVLPPGATVDFNGLLKTCLLLYAGFIEVAFRIGIPVIITLLLVDLFMGLVGKSMPQLNIFLVGLPLKIGLGLVVVIAMLSPVYNLFQETTFKFFEIIYTSIGG
jgi:flagellar biosynthetic protein FliR